MGDSMRIFFKKNLKLSHRQTNLDLYLKNKIQLIFTILISLLFTNLVTAENSSNSWHLAANLDEISETPYFGVGTLVNHVVGGWCTAYAVSNKVILTNSHCLSYMAYVSPDTTKFMSQRDVTPEMIQFYFNVHDMQYTSKHWVKSIEKGPWSKTGKIQDDWAIIILENAIENFQNKVILGLDPISANTPIQIVGYPNTSLESIAQISNKCKIVQSSPETNSFTHDCKSTFGSSGSPVIRFFNGRYHLIGIHHANFLHSDGTPQGIAVNILPILHKIKESIDSN